MSDGVTPEMAETDLGNGTKVKHPKGTVPVRMTSEEKALLSGLVAARNAIDREIEGATQKHICSRLGVHITRVSHVHTDIGIIILASDAPMPAVPEEAARA